MSEAYIIDAVRTPRGIGKVGKGALAGLHPQHLAVTRSSERCRGAMISTPRTWMTSSGDERPERQTRR